MPSLSTPHPDIELGLPRRPVEYGLTIPAGGIGPRTGLVVYIHGLGWACDDAYADKLLSHLADRYDLVAVAVRYHGTGLYTEEVPAIPVPDFFARIAQHYGITINAPPGVPWPRILDKVAETLRARGLVSLHPDCSFIRLHDEHYSFGVLPALDILGVVHAVMRAHSLNRRRFFAIGTSYGGYIALLLAKFAPNTFRMVVDNSGFTAPADHMDGIYGKNWGIGCGGLEAVCRNRYAFSDDSASPFFFTPSHHKIRDMCEVSHFQQADTALFTYHSTVDSVASPERKRELGAALAGFRRYEQTFVGTGDLDGHLFKTHEHGMQASLRGLFARSYERWLPLAENAPEVTDFDLGSDVTLACGDRTYCLSYSPTQGVRLSQTASG